MDKDRLAQRLMATFIVELDGHVRAFEQGLLALERNPAPAARAEILGALLRTAHSLKGAARSVKVDLLETASHRLEEVLSAARDGRIVADTTFFDVLLPTIDAVGDVAQRLRAGTGLADASLVERIRFLPALLKGERGSSPVPRRSAPESIGEDPPAYPVVATVARPLANSVRVSSEKLDNLLWQSGELLVVRHRAEARSESAGQLRSILSEWRAEWRRMEQELSALLRREAESEDQDEGAEVPVRRHLDVKRRSMIELAINRSRDSLWRLDRGLHRFVVDLEADHRAIELTAVPLDETIRQVRMFPFSEACQGLERAIRDLVAGGEKAVSLVVEGGEIELDRMVLEGIRDPLLHLVRNAVDHGIEPVAERRAAGKPDAGTIAITVALRGTRVEITVRDDGKGLDLAAVADRLSKSERTVPDDEQELLRVIFEPGFTTASAVTQVSGRGVGLDVVKTQLAAIRGAVDVAFVAGAGTTFTLNVPLTLTSLRAVLVGVGSESYAIDTASVDRAIRVDEADIRSVGEREMIILAGEPVPIVTLADAVGAPARPSVGRGKIPALILVAGDRRAALAVDALEAEREVVVRALGPRLRRIPGVAGGTILASGRIALILNAAELVERATARPAGTRLADAAVAAEKVVRRRLLVVDDSATIRTLEKSILEAAGYDVMVAADGHEAWHLLLEAGADLVVSDVEMPRMDGFSLTEAIRASKRFHDLPVVLVTAMESEADKARGLAVGATAYRPKSAFDQKDLLATIERIL